MVKSPEDLDEMVHECASIVASDVNNAGVEAQLKFLETHYGIDWLEQHIKKL